MFLITALSLDNDMFKMVSSKYCQSDYNNYGAIKILIKHVNYIKTLFLAMASAIKVAQIGRLRNK